MAWGPLLQVLPATLHPPSRPPGTTKAAAWGLCPWGREHGGGPGTGRTGTEPLTGCLVPQAEPRRLLSISQFQSYDHLRVGVSLCSWTLKDAKPQCLSQDVTLLPERGGAGGREPAVFAAARHRFQLPCQHTGAHIPAFCRAGAGSQVPLGNAPHCPLRSTACQWTLGPDLCSSRGRGQTGWARRPRRGLGPHAQGLAWGCPGLGSRCERRTGGGRKWKRPGPRSQSPT